MSQKIFALIILLTGAFLLFSAFQNAQTKTMNFPNDPYTSEWNKIDSLEREGLIRSALEQVQALQEKAKKDKNPAQIVKTTIYYNKYQLQLEEAGSSKALQRMRQDLEQADFPVKPILQSLLAELYANYADQNYWKLKDRTSTGAELPEDIETWSLDQFLGEASRLYLASVQDERSFSVPISDFDAITYPGNEWTNNLRPTLYDFLAHRAIDHFSNERSYLSEPAYQFTLSQKEVFAPVRQFIQTPFETKDSSAFKYQACLLFQDVLKKHASAAAEEALLDVNFKRLDFMRNNSVLPNKDSLYWDALLVLEKDYKGTAAQAELWYRMAQYNRDQGNQYNPLAGDTYKWKLKEALELCQKAQKEYPNSYGAKMCQQLIQELSLASLKLTVEEVNIPGQSFPASVEYRNASSAWFRIIALSEAGHQEIRSKSPEEAIQWLRQQKVHKAWNINLPNDGDLQQHRAEIAVEGLPFGRYAILLSNDNEFLANNYTTGYLFTTISSLSYLERKGKTGSSEFLVLDRNSGQPLSGVLGEFFTTKYNRNQRRSERVKIGQALSNEKGFLIPDIANSDNYFQVRLSKGQDVLDFEDGFSNYTRSSRNAREYSTHFFLDRAIYRPGQSLYFKTLVMQYGPDQMPKIVANQKITVTLYDVNGQKVADLALRTNEYGTANGVFTLPQFGLLGQMRLSADLGRESHYFAVEEYKRPKFEVTFDSLAGSPALGEVLAMTGKAMTFAGSSLSDATVRYRVVREVQFPWLPWWGWYRYFPTRGQSMELASGEVATQPDGSFEIAFTALPDETVKASDNPEFTYTVYADVIDITGETHSASKSIRLANLGLKVDMTFPEYADRSAGMLRLDLSTQNLDGKAQPAAGSIKIQQLDAPEKTFIERLWSKPDIYLMDKATYEKNFPHFAYQQEDEWQSWPVKGQVLELPFNTANANTVSANLSGLPIGYYKVTLSTKDTKGNAIEIQKKLTVYDAAEKRLPKGVLAWKNHQNAKAYEPGEQAVFQMMSAEKELHLLYEIERKLEIVDQSWLTLKPWAEKTYEVTVQDKGNVFAYFTFVKYGRAFTWTENLEVPWSDKELKIEYATFRDKLKPGAEENWQIKISGSKKEKVAAEMVAAMYDASLDQFRPHNWSFSPFPMNYRSRSWTGHHFGSESSYHFYYYPYIEGLPDKAYRSLNWFGFYLYDNIRLAGAPITARSYSLEGAPAGRGMEKKEADMPIVPEPAMDSNFSAESVMDVSAPAPYEQVEQAKPEAQIRQNLKETVFFFPELRTDAEGNVILQFTMNEALTRWKLLTFAHSKELQYGLSEKEVVTQKELMVLPNPPRFMREGDAITYTAKVDNLTAETLKGVARLQLFDALSMKPVDDLLKNGQPEIPFEVKGGQSAPLAWNIQIPVGQVMALTHRVVVEAGNFSDGEEAVLPILTNRMLVTESMPMPLKGKEKKTFRFQAMDKATASNTLQHHSFTLEYSSNPAWYAVKALPYLMDYPYECSEQIFSRYYANALATTVANTTPRIKQVFASWSSSDALLSELHKNEALKAVLLEETPWVLDAQSEAEQRKRIALLFDLNRMSYEQNKALQTLQERQSASGGFAWFAGGQESWYITQYITEGLGRLEKLGVQQSAQGQRIAQNAVRFIDEEFQDHYRRLLERVEKKQAKLEDDHLSDIIIHYLYTRSMFPAESGNQPNEAQDYFLQQAEKYWTQKGIYQQGLLALALHYKGKEEAAQRIVRSLKERALAHDELGMYWNYPNGYFWYQMPIETHVLMVEVFSEVAKDQAAVEQLKIWLLKNKQTNDWKTTKATANAVYALLRFGSNWLDASAPVAIDFPKAKGQAAKEQVRQAQSGAEAGTGYFSTSWKGADIQTGFQEIQINNPNANIAWGAAYWQYFEDLDKIKGFKETPLSLVKQVYREVASDRGPKLEAISAASPLRVGDKLVVRLELRVDRDMEYVHMKDLRASGLEPTNVFSHYKWQGGLGYYESTKDAATHFFFDYLPKGTYVFEYALRVIHQGDFSNGLTSIQCMYAPEFSSHTEGIRLKVVGK